MRKVDNHGLMGFLCAVFDLTRLGFAVFEMRVFSDKSGIFCRAIRGSWLTPPLSPKRFQLFLLDRSCPACGAVDADGGSS